MSIDTRQKRMSAINPASPWRGPMVVPTGAASQAIRQAAAFMYSGILADAIVVEAAIYPGDATISRQGVGDATVARQGVSDATFARQGVGSASVCKTGS